jgi:starvation-inducible outer membrane lipoprotein
MEGEMFYLFLSILMLTSCQYIPEMAEDIESIENDTAIRVEVSRETIQKQTDLGIIINVQNKDEPFSKQSNK